jgi:DNA-binding transcriptional LysR family regulator
LNGITKEMLDWNDLRYFLAVARSGSTLAASKALGLSQSTVHRRLTALETNLGRRLFRRRATGYQLTRLGEEMRPYAERVQASVASFERHFASRDPSRTGTVRVACPASAAHRLMRSRMLEKFQARCPGLRAEFVMTEGFVDLAQGEADLAIRQGAPEDKALIGRRIADVPWAIFGSRTYVERHGRPAQPKDIAKHSVVEYSGAMKNHAAALWMRSVAPRATVAARGESFSEVLMAVKSSVGLAPLPVPFAASDGDLVPVIGPMTELIFPFYLVIHREMKRAPRVRAFLNFVTAETKIIYRALFHGLPGERPIMTLTSSGRRRFQIGQGRPVQGLPARICHPLARGSSSHDGRLSGSPLVHSCGRVPLRSRERLGKQAHRLHASRHAANSDGLIW